MTCSPFVLSKYTLIKDVTKGQVQPAALSVQKQSRHFIFLRERVFVSPPSHPKKPQSSARVQREVERKRKVVLFFIFCSCALVRFSSPGKRGASLWQPQGCSCGTRRRQFHQAPRLKQVRVEHSDNWWTVSWCWSRRQQIYIPVESVFPSRCVVQQCRSIHFIPTAGRSQGSLTFPVVHIHW